MVTLGLGGNIMDSDEKIRELAYFLWQQEGCPDGKDTEHYFRAKKILEDQEFIPSEAIEIVSAECVPVTPKPASPRKRKTSGVRRKTSKKKSAE
jgi:hypothetical protein